MDIYESIIAKRAPLQNTTIKEKVLIMSGMTIDDLARRRLIVFQDTSVIDSSTRSFVMMSVATIKTSNYLKQVSVVTVNYNK
jgi:hypothetical protein